MKVPYQTSVILRYRSYNPVVCVYVCVYVYVCVCVCVCIYIYIYIYMYVSPSHWMMKTQEGSIIVHLSFILHVRLGPLAFL